ncbi:MAG: FMN-binding protein [Flavobacteriaceae bacterium]|nr:FMN-binding protein [Flavobacteriaceae bacterium]
MNYKVMLVSLMAFVLVSFSIPKRVHKKIDKQIKATFEVEVFEKIGVEIPEDIQQELVAKLTAENFFSIHANDEKIGYFYFGHGFGKTDKFDFMVIFDTDLVIAKTKILVYREDHGSEIGSRRWLRQFNGKKGGDTLRYQHNIAAISGATLSAESMTEAVNDLLESIAILYKKNIL